MTDQARPVILIICDYYLPGFESGGAMRTLVNMVDRLSDRFDFRIVTRDHDGPLDRIPYSTVKIDTWNQVGGAQVHYLSPKSIHRNRLRELIAEVRPDVVYVNSFFSPLTISVLLLKRLRQIDVPVILAPEGELSTGALTIKRPKKRLYIAIAKLLGLLSFVEWKAASDSELQDIRREFGSTMDVQIAPNMPPKILSPGYDPSQKPKKAAGDAKLIFLSRFMRKKNFNWLARHLASVNGRLTIDIWGPLEDPDYYEESCQIAADLPSNVEIVFKGPVGYEDVAATLVNYHFFVLPTLGENFGHVFIEALAAGCPLLISDRTPWRHLTEKEIGWDIPLEHPEQWISAIDECISMSEDAYADMSRSAREFAVRWLSDPGLEASNVHVLERAIGKA